MAMMKEFYIDSADEKHKLHAMRWDTAGKPKGTVQIVHGISEHAARYDEYASFLADNGYVVFAEDILGHGKSFTDEDDRGFTTETDGWVTIVSDLANLSKLIKDEYPDITHFMLGHSMGSFLARTYIIDYPGELDGCILSGTGQQSKALVNAGLAVISLVIKITGGKAPCRFMMNMAAASYNKRIKSPRTGFDWLTTDTEMVDACISDPLCGFAGSATLYRDMLFGIKYISRKENLNRMNKDIPVYLYSGGDDPVGDYGKGVERAAKLLCDCGMKNVTAKLYPGGRHEMHNEKIRYQVFSDTLNWMEGVAGPLRQSKSGI